MYNEIIIFVSDNNCINGYRKMNQYITSMGKRLFKRSRIIFRIDEVESSIICMRREYVQIKHYRVYLAHNPVTQLL